ncbi:MAG: twin-arginine translocase subunit TatC [Xanthomonadales bacterium]|nr:twin-arginine translocase subunit TatC [Xanthomonadales bacterium]
MSSSADDDVELPFISHLAELRDRLLRAIMAVLLVLIALIPFAGDIYTRLATPLIAKLPAGSQMIAIDLAAPFFTPLKLVFLVAVVITAPWILYQVWAFVAPGLYQREQKLAIPLLVSSTLLFYLGCAFAYFLVLPSVISFLMLVTPEGVAMMTDMSRFLDFVVMLFLSFGVTFEVPVATVILVAMGWVELETLRQSRRYFVVGAFIVAAIVTPPDVISQIMLAVPMCLLFEVGILASAALVRQRAAEDARESADSS